MAKKAVLIVPLIAFALLVSTAPRAAEQPLAQDDVQLLLLGGATTEKMISLIEQRGINFRMTPDLAKKFHDAGARDEVIEALQKAGQKVNPAAPSAVPAQPVASMPAPPSGNVASPTSPAKPASAPNLTDPSPDQIQRIVQEFAAKEKLFKEARNNYTYHQINKVEEMDPDGNAAGAYQQDWDILYDDNGKRIERVTYAPPDTLRNLIVTAEDLNSMRNIQPFVLTTDEVRDYDIKYLGHVKVDEIMAYVFSIRPKEIQKGRLYFQGVVWVDDRDLQIVKTEGKTVPELKSKKGQMNLFPRFTTYREQIDGKFWFPTYTAADDTLYFPGAPVRVREVIRYTDYKQYKATSTIRMISETSGEENKGQAKSSSSKNPSPKQ